MSKKASTGKTGSGSHETNTAPGERTGGGTDDEEEEEEEEETPPSDKSKGGDGKQGDGKGKGTGDDELDLSGLDEKTQSYIKKLRRESAKYRTKATNLETSHSQLTDRIKKIAGGGGGEEGEMSAEERLAMHEQSSSQLAFENAVLQAAVQQGIGAGGLKYFRFLVNEKASELGEGEELTDEDLADIAEEARTATGKGGERQRTKTSVTGSEDGKGQEGKRPGGKETVSLEQFSSMTISQKSDLQKNNPELYAALFKEAVNKRRLV